jgi:hypothetical protein
MGLDETTKETMVDAGEARYYVLGYVDGAAHSMFCGIRASAMVGGKAGRRAATAVQVGCGVVTYNLAQLLDVWSYMLLSLSRCSSLSSRQVTELLIFLPRSSVDDIIIAQSV